LITPRNNIYLGHVLLVLPDGRVDHRVGPNALGVLARGRTIPLLVVLLQLLLVAQTRVLLEDVCSGFPLVHGTVLRLRIAAVAGRRGAGGKAFPLDALVVQGLAIEGEHGAGPSGLSQASLTASARGAGGVLPLLGGWGQLVGRNLKTLLIIFW